MQHLLHLPKRVSVAVLVARALHHRHARRLTLLEGSTSRYLGPQWYLHQAVLLLAHLAR